MTLRIGVIGIGYMGANHARVYANNDDARVVALSDVDIGRTKKLATRYGAAAYSSYKEMLQKEKLDAVSICVPTSLHKEVATAALQAGLPVLLEKPAAPSVKESEEIQRAAEKAGAVVLLGHIERFNPAVRASKELLRKEHLSDVFLIDTERVSPRSTRIADVGVVTDLAVHDIDVMRFVLGREVEQVYARTKRVFTKGVEDYGEAMLFFEGGAIGHLRVNWLTPTKIRRFRVQGKFGMLDGDYITQDLLYYENRGAVEESGQFAEFLLGISESEMRKVLVKKEEPLGAEIRHFINCVEGKAKPEVTVRDGMATLEVVEAIYRSAAGDGVVELRG